VISILELDALHSETKIALKPIKKMLGLFGKQYLKQGAHDRMIETGQIECGWYQNGEIRLTHTTKSAQPRATNSCLGVG
jgi:hypothetical protein